MSENEAAVRPMLQELVVDHPAWREALGQVRAALSRPSAVVALLGPAGTGKTLLLRTLLDELRDDGRDAVLLERGDAEDHPEARPGIVLVDEADRIGSATLEAVAEAEALAESGVDGVVFAALPSFAERIEAMPGATVVPLRPLRAEEAAAFVQARAEAMGGAPGRLTSEASAEIVANGKGIPRLLGALLTASDFVASLKASPRVTAEHVQDAVSLRGEMETDLLESLPAEPGERDGDVCRPDRVERWVESASPVAAPPEPTRRRSRAGVLVAGVALAALIAAYAAIQLPGRSPARQAANPTPDRPSAAAAATPSSPAPPPATPASEPAQRRAAEAVPAPSQAPGLLPGSAAAGLPKGIVPHVILSYQQGDAQAERRGIEAARALRAAGLEASDPVPVLGRITDPGVAYFFAEDQAGAAEISRVLGSAFGKSRAVALRANEPLPRPGTIEVQLPSAQPGMRLAE
ncbi:MAG: hypothetical protein JO157_01970 [Acetobacteraceae bacterium]|nr:hypothetical protein [Acetobacteraceae bacterium]